MLSRLLHGIMAVSDLEPCIDFYGAFEEQPRIGALCCPGRPMLKFNSPDGMKLQIVA